jgi:hypothetical protein
LIVTLSRILLSLCAALLLISCGGRDKSQFRSPYADEELMTGVYRVAEPEDLAAAMTTRFQPHEELWVKADVVIRDRAANEKDFFTAKAMYRRPSNLRMSGSRTPIGTIFDLLIVRDDAWITFPREGQSYVGSVVELTEKLGTIGGLGPEQLVAAVLVHQDLIDRINSGVPYSVKIKDRDHLLMATRDPKTLRQFIWTIRRDDGLVDEILVRSHSGVPELQVFYHEYRMVENESTGVTEPFPYDFTIYVPRNNVMVNTDVSEYKMDEPLPSRAFEPVKAREVYPLSALRFEEDP